MGEANWTALTDELVLASLDRGVTTGVPRPNGGGNFIFGFNSLVVATGAAGYFTNQANFAPTPANKGGRVTGAIQRGPSAGLINFAPFFYILGQGTSVNDKAYMLGLQDEDPNRIVLRKGTLVSGLPSGAPNPTGTNNILRRSTSTFANGAWHHLRLDAVVNVNGDVILKVFSNDLGANSVAAPIWTPVAGIEDPTLIATHGAGTAFVDDSLAVNSGSAPFTSGRMGFGFFTKDISRRGYFDHIECIRQT